MTDESRTTVDVELLEMRVSRLESILAAQAYRPSPHLALDAPVTYAMDDPRLVLYGAYPPERPQDELVPRWFGQRSHVQMVFPHGRGAAQTARLVLRPFRNLDLRQVRALVDEASVAPRFTPAETPKNAIVMELSLPPAYGPQTEIHLTGLPLGSPKDYGVPDNPRLLSFLLFTATFVPTDVGETPASG